MRASAETINPGVRGGPRVFNAAVRGPRARLAGVFLLLFFCAAYSHHRGLGGATALSRLDLLHSLALRGSFSIDDRHENTPDKAYFHRHYYSDKAPGAAFLALPAYAIGVAAAASAGIDPESREGWLWASWMACAGSMAVATGIGGVALYLWLSRRVAPRAALLTVLAVFLGAAPLPYSTMLFSHAAVAAMLSVALWALDRPAPPGRLAERRFDILGGAACGLALASEYTAGIVVVGLLLWSGRRGPLSITWIAGGMVLPLALIPAYSWICLGVPWRLPYSFQASFPEMQAGLYAIQWPNATVAWNLLFSPARGLFFWSPFLLLALAGFGPRSRNSRGLFWLCYSGAALQIIVMSGRQWDWGAGPTFSARYLTPILPLLALPCALAVERFPRTAIGLAVLSVALTTLATLTDACPELRLHPNPVLDLQLPLLVRGDLAPNLGVIAGFSPYGSLALYYLVLVSGTRWLWRGVSAIPAQAAAGSVAGLASPIGGVAGRLESIGR